MALEQDGCLYKDHNSCSTKKSDAEILQHDGVAYIAMMSHEL